MAKVSKNIKKFRTEARLTQDALAEKINVTRQTVSSWETGRTQPDFEMLELLSSALGASIEELIYGERHKVGLEPEKTDTRKIINIILASVGSLLTVIGLIIMFIVIWEEMPPWVLPTLMYVPLFAGVCVAAFAKAKKSNSVPWCESASVAWIAGLIATVTLIVTNADTIARNFDTGFILSAVTLLILPVAFIMQTFTGIAAFSASAVSWSSFMLTAKENLPVWLVGTVLLLACGFAYTAFINRNDVRRKFSFIVNILSSAFCVGYTCAYFSKNPLTASVCFVATFLIAVYATDKGDVSVYPFRFVTVPLLIFFSTFICYGLHVFCDGSGTITFAEPLPWVMLVMLAAGIYFGRHSLGKNALKITFCTSSLVSVFTQLAYTYADELPYTNDGNLKYFLFDLLIATAMVAAVASATVTIIKGVKTAKMSTLNLGLVSLFAVVLAALVRMDFDLIVYGIVFVIMGTVLLVINSRMSKKFKAKEDERNV